MRLWYIISGVIVAVLLAASGWCAWRSQYDWSMLLIGSAGGFVLGILGNVVANRHNDDMREASNKRKYFRYAGEYDAYSASGRVKQSYKVEYLLGGALLISSEEVEGIVVLNGQNGGEMDWRTTGSNPKHAVGTQRVQLAEIPDENDAKMCEICLYAPTNEGSRLFLIPKNRRPKRRPPIPPRPVVSYAQRRYQAFAQMDDQGRRDDHDPSMS